MSSVQIQASATGTGVVKIAAPATSSSATLTLPAAATTIVGTDVTQTLTNKTLGPGLVMLDSAITSLSEVATTSGSSVVLASSFPTWVRAITVVLNNVSLSGTSNMVIQLGTTPIYGTWYSSSYSSVTANYSSLATAPNTASNGFRVGTLANAASAYTIVANLYAVRPGSGTSNPWICQFNGIVNTAGVFSVVFGSGEVNVPTLITGVRLFSTDTFDSGTASVSYQ